MWRAAWHLFVRSFDATVGLFQTSKLAIAVTVAALLFPHARVIWSEGVNMPGLRRLWANIWQDVGLGGLLVLAVWLVLIAASAVRGIYRDHVTFVETVQVEKGNTREYWQKWQTDEGKIKDLQQSVYPVIKKDIAKQCWGENRTTYPNARIRDSLYGIETIIHCNYLIRAPLEIEVNYSGDILSGLVQIPGASAVINGGGGQDSRRKHCTWLFSDELVAIEFCDSSRGTGRHNGSCTDI